MASHLSQELACAAARLVVEEGMEYGPAKRRAARDLGKSGLRSVDLPSNNELEDEVRAYIDIFCADTQAAELRALREVALHWMLRLQDFRPHLTGAVWRGTATRLSSVHLQLYCDDSKEAEIALLNERIDFDTASLNNPKGEPINVLTLAHPRSHTHPALGGEPATVHLSILAYDDLRGALKPDAQGRTERGDLRALQNLMQESPP